MNHRWPLMPLAELLVPVNRSERVNPAKQYNILGARWYAAGLYTKDVAAGSTIRADRLYRVERGDFVYNRLFGWKGSFAIASDKNHGCYVSNEFPCFAVRSDRADGEYLWKYFSRTAVWDEVLSLSTGGTPTSRNRLKEAQLLAMKIPLPSLPEQRRIVSRIEELSAKIEEARGLRQESQEEAEALVNATAARVFFDLGRIGITLVDEICEVKGGIQKSSVRTPGANPRRYITVAHVQRNRIDTSDPRYFEVSDAELERWRLLPGDVLVIEGNGSADQIGRAAIFKGEIEDCVHQNHVIRVRPNPARLLPEYLNTYFNSPVGRDQMLERSRTTSGLFNLSVGRIQNIEVPLPSIPEQRRIVSYLDDQQAKVNVVERLQEEAAAELNALMPSILSRAFSGEF